MGGPHRPAECDCLGAGPRPSTANPPPLAGGFGLAAGHKEVTPIGLCQLDGLAQFAQVAMAQFQRREVEPLERQGVGLLEEGEVVSAFVFQDLGNRRAQVRGEELPDRAPSSLR